MHGGAFGDEILKLDAHTLTDYRADVTNVQDVQPLAAQRGVFLDGSLHHGIMLPLSIAGHPSGDGWNRGADFNGVFRQDTGTYVASAVDLSLPAPGFRWVIGRTYNVRQHDGSSFVDGDSYQGINWHQSSQPELVYHDYGNNGTDDAEDAVYLVYGADRYIEFTRYFIGDAEGLSDTTFRAVNGAAGVVVRTEKASAPDEWVYHDPNGYTATFFGIQGVDDSDIPNAKEGLLWKIEDAAGNVAHVGDDSTDATNAANALSAGYDSSGKLEYVIDTAGRRYDFAYTAIASVDRLTSVTVKEWNGSSWDATGDEVEYDYYDDYDTTSATEDSFGIEGDLRLVTVTRPTTDSGNDIELKTYYRYYQGTFDAGSNPGTDHHLQYVFESEGLRQWDYDEEADSDLDEGFLTAHITNDDL